MDEADVDPESQEWHEVRILFGGFLHHDFDLVHGDAWPAVCDYAAQSTDDDLVVGARSLRALVTMFDDQVLERAVHRFGMAYHPTGDGYSSYRLWLTAVADFLEDPEAHPGPPERDAPVPRREGVGGRTSTYTDDHTAERAVATSLRLNRRAIAAWMAGGETGPNRAFEYHHSHAIGRLAPHEATPETIHDVDRSRVILRKKTDVPAGWFVLVTYPVDDPDPVVADAVDRTAAEWVALWSLLGGYLHQDFDIHGGALDAVAAFTSEASSDEVAGAASALRRLLGDGGEAYLAAATEWLGMDYYPRGDGRTYREWLTAVAEQLER